MKFVSVGRMIAAFLFVAMATMLASSSVGAHMPLEDCDFFIEGHQSDIPVINICPTGDVAYTNEPGRIKRYIRSSGNVRDVKAVNSNGCSMSNCPHCSWDRITCAEKFSTIEEWIHKRNLQDNADWFLNKYIKISISNAQLFLNGNFYANYNSNGDPKACLIIKTSTDFADPNFGLC